MAKARAEGIFSLYMLAKRPSQEFYQPSLGLFVGTEVLTVAFRIKCQLTCNFIYRITIFGI